MQRPSSSGDRALASGAGSAGSIPAWGTLGDSYFRRCLLGLDVVPCISIPTTKQLSSAVHTRSKLREASATWIGSIPAWGTAALRAAVLSTEYQVLRGSADKGLAEGPSREQRDVLLLSTLYFLLIQRFVDESGYEGAV